MVDDDERREHEEPSDTALDLDPSALFVDACAAFCRGRLALPPSTPNDDAIRAGRLAGLRLHRFKRARPLPRVQRILATLRGLSPQSILDVGTGRGVMLWPLLEAFPDVEVTCVDVRDDRVADLEAVARGGFPRLRAVCGHIESVALPAGGVDVVIASEVLEHVGDERAAAQALVNAARHFVIVTVPSLPDDNPEHIRLFTAETLRALFLQAGATRVHVDGVRGHFFAAASVRR